MGSRPGRRRPRLDYVSPLPPVRSGIADYSRDLLPHLEPLCDLRVIGLPDQPVADEMVERWHPVAAEECGRDDRLPLYQMGNNVYHEGVLKLALERPGVVTLHDLVLHHLLIEMTLGRDPTAFEEYGRRLVADHGWRGEVMARARQWGELAPAGVFALPANRTLVRRQRGVLVHSRWAAAELRREVGGEMAIGILPMAIPLPSPPAATAVASFRRRLGVGERTPLLGSFGFQTPIKRTPQIVRALGLPPLASAHLLVAGEVSPRLGLEAAIAEAGVGDRVHVTGFLGADEFAAAISACDVCINLRYPTAGETSASLLRVLALGQPAVVSDYAQLRELPDDAVVKIPLGEGECEALAAEVSELLGHRARLEAMSEAAREHVRREHDPGRAAAVLVESCRAFSALQPPGEVPAREPAPTTLTWRDLPGGLEVEGADGPWPEGARRRLRISLRNGSRARWLSARHDVGGVMLELRWLGELAAGSSAKSIWLPLEREVAPGRTVDLDAEVRRPLGARSLHVEPHLRGLCGFSSLGGPTWASEI